MTDDHPFHIFLPQHVVPLRRRALALSRHPHQAEDLVQTTLLKAWASRDSYIPGSNLRAWLFTILRNTYFSDLRKHRRETEDVDGLHAQALSEGPSHDQSMELKELILSIALLPPVQRRALMLMGAYGFTQIEAADACRCTVGTIKSRVSRGRAALHRIMDRDDPAYRALPLATAHPPLPAAAPRAGPGERLREAEAEVA